MRRANHTPSWDCTWSQNRSSAALRAGRPTVQPDRHHLRIPLLPFAIQHIEGIAQVGEPFLTVGEAGR